MPARAYGSMRRALWSGLNTNDIPAPDGLFSLDVYGGVADYVGETGTITTSLSTPQKPTFSAGSRGITVADIGKVIQIGQADSTSARDFRTVIESDGAGSWRLRDAATVAVTNQNWHMGTDCSLAIDNAIRAGGFYVPDHGRGYLDAFPGHLYRNSGLRITWMGSGYIVIGGPPDERWLKGEGTGSNGFGGRGHWIHNQTYTAVHNQSGGLARCSLLELYGRGNYVHIRPGHGHTNADESKSIKALAITQTDNFIIKGINYFSDQIGAKLFCLTVENCTKGIISDVSFIQVYGNLNGADTLHFLGNCADILVIRCTLASQDDASSQTHEHTTRTPGCTISRITYIDCDLWNNGHSAVKILIGTSDGTDGQGIDAIIEDITYINCRMRSIMNGGTDPNFSANAASIWCVNKNRVGIVRRIKIIGGFSKTYYPSATIGGVPEEPYKGFRTDVYATSPNPMPSAGAAQLYFSGVDDIEIIGVEMFDPVRYPILFKDCSNITLYGCTRKLQRTSNLAGSSALITLTNCSGFINIQPEGSGLQKSWASQNYMNQS